MSYNRRKVLRVLVANGVQVVREGGGHTILRGPDGKPSSLPRHANLDRVTTRAIVRQLGSEWDGIVKEL